MSSHTNFKSEKCWSCAFYAGRRKISKFLGPSIDTDERGQCTCNKCPNSGKIVSENNYCSKWQIDSMTNQCQIEQANKKAAQTAQREADRAQRRIEEHNREVEREREEERRYKEREEEARKYQDWYNSLSPEEKAAEDAKNAEERRLAEERIRKFQKELKEKNRIALLQQKKRKKILLISFISLVAITGIVIASVFIAKAINQKQAEDTFNNSDTGKLLALIRQDSGGKDSVGGSVDLQEGCKASFGLEYKKDGWINNYNEITDFRGYCQLTARTEDHYTTTTGFCWFNLDGSNTTKSSHLYGAGACFASDTYYGNSEVITQYQMITYNKSTKLMSYGTCYYQYKNWNQTYSQYTDEWTERGFYACNLINEFINEYCAAAFGGTFWK